MKFTKNTAQWEKVKANLLKNIPELNTGFFSGSNYGPENGNLPVAQVAQWNEEGSSDNPPRPFMRVGFGGVLRAGKLDKNIASAITRIAEGESPMQSLKILGPVFVNEMRQQIIDWDSPPNSPKTVELKGFNDPLRDTDTMLNSVDYRVGSV
jgi:hypothetical protein